MSKVLEVEPSWISELSPIPNIRGHAGVRQRLMKPPFDLDPPPSESKIKRDSESGGLNYLRNNKGKAKHHVRLYSEQDIARYYFLP